MARIYRSILSDESKINISVSSYENELLYLGKELSPV